MRNKQTIIIIILIVIIIALFAFVDTSKIKNIFSKETIKTEENEFKGLEKNLEELNQDIDFYKHFDLYLSLLDDDGYNYVKEKMDDLETSTEELENLFILLVMNKFFENEKTKGIITELKENVYRYKKLTKEEEDELFEKNNTCANLITGINEQLSNKYKESDDETTEKEELDFIFYSPKMKTCLYSTKYNYNYYSGYPDYKTYWYTAKIIYNANTNNKIKEYRTYYSLDYPYKTKEEIDRETEKNEKDYNKFILENSNYNSDLLRDMSIF